jgi:hypothetical protein
MLQAARYTKLDNRLHRVYTNVFLRSIATTLINAHASVLVLFVPQFTEIFPDRPRCRKISATAFLQLYA